MHREPREYSTAGIVLGFARCGVSIETISRALVTCETQVEAVCRRALNSGELAAMPPQARSDQRGALASDNANLRARVSDLEEQLRALGNRGQNVANRLRGWCGLTGKEARMLSLLLDRGIASKESLYVHLYESRLDSDSPEPKIIDVFVCKIRKKLPEGVTIGTKWGFGYEISDESARRLRELAGLREVESPSLVPEMEAA